MTLARALLVAFTALALTSPAALAQQDLRSPDTRDAATRLSGPRPFHEQDLRSPDARDAATQQAPRPEPPAGADPAGDGIAPIDFVFGITGTFLVGLVVGSGLHLLRTRRRHATRLAT